jgi:hypothetical protein
MTNLRAAAHLGSGEGGGAEPAQQQPTRFRFAPSRRRFPAKLDGSAGQYHATFLFHAFSTSLATVVMA